MAFFKNDYAEVKHFLWFCHVKNTIYDKLFHYKKYFSNMLPGNLSLQNSVWLLQNINYAYMTYFAQFMRNVACDMVTFLVEKKSDIRTSLVPKTFWSNMDIS